MTFATAIRPALARARAIAGRMGLRPVPHVWIVQVEWSGAYPGDGTRTESLFELLQDGQPPKVRDLRGDEIAMGMGPAGSIKIGPITPGCMAGGALLSDLQPTLDAGEGLSLKLVDPSGETLYLRIDGVEDKSALHYYLSASPLTKGDQE